MGRHSYLIAMGSNRWGRGGGPRAVVANWGLANWGQSPISTELIGDSPQLVILVASRVHTTAPIGPGTRSYANTVALIETDLPPLALLAHLKSIERAHGRRPGRRWGDRPLDLDIIGWSGGLWKSRALGIPHPAFRTRRFVLAPLAEIAPDWRDPLTHLTAQHLLARLDRKRPRA